MNRLRLAFVLMLLAGWGVLPAIVMQARKDSWVREFIAQARDGRSSGDVWAVTKRALGFRRGPKRASNR